jgi:hypothetical protein
MLQVTDDLIRSVVQEVLSHMKPGAGPVSVGKPSPQPLSLRERGRGEGRWGVFDSVDDAVAAAADAQQRFERMGTIERKKAVDCIRKICITKAEQLGLARAAVERQPRDAARRGRRSAVAVRLRPADALPAPSRLAGRARGPSGGAIAFGG